MYSAYYYVKLLLPLKYLTQRQNVYRLIIVQNLLDIFASEKNNHNIFKITARRLGAKLKRIKLHNPKRNGKIVRLHRDYQELFHSEVVRTNRLITDKITSK